ncbi:MAG: helix-turn-helix domain-containing protein [Ruminococcaceae bacterium]|nr:helix-turn-helix domain-containing protein [Oscillospiraceae bacterium]
MEFVLQEFREDLLVTRLANVHYFEFTPSFHTADDSHDFCELVYVDKGKIEIKSENYTGKLKENHIIFHNAGEVHSLTCSEDAAPNIIIIGFESNSRELDVLTHAPLKLSDELQKMLAEIIKEARSVYLPPYDVPNQREMKKREGFAFGADQLLKNYLQIFLIKVLRMKENILENERAEQRVRDGSSFPQIGEVKEYLEANFTEKIAIDELCFLFNTNKTTLTREFKRAYGVTIVEYLSTLRIELTKKLLLEGQSLTKIADTLNLSSVHYLSAMFKKSEEISPSEYIGTMKKST